MRAEIWPQDAEARPGITVERRLRCGCTSEAYLAALQSALAELAASAFQPHLVIHNAGTDILDGDPLGRCGPLWAPRILVAQAPAGWTCGPAACCVPER